MLRVIFGLSPMRCAAIAGQLGESQEYALDIAKEFDQLVHGEAFVGFLINPITCPHLQINLFPSVAAI